MRNWMERLEAIDSEADTDLDNAMDGGVRIALKAFRAAIAKAVDAALDIESALSNSAPLEG